MQFGFWVATWEEAWSWWHEGRRDHHAAALAVLSERHRARVVSWINPAGSAVTTTGRIPRQGPGPRDDDLSS